MCAFWVRISWPNITGTLVSISLGDVFHCICSLHVYLWMYTHTPHVCNGTCISACYYLM